MPTRDVIALLEDTQAVLRNTHVVYTSGRHGEAYINKDALYMVPTIVAEICQHLANRFMDENVEAVAAPAVGGVALSQWTAFLLSRSRSVLAVFAEKQPDGTFEFRRGYGPALAGKHVLVVDDILTTGASLRGVADAARGVGAVVDAAAAICNRGGVTALDIHVPRLATLAELPLQSWPVDACPLCRAHVPVNTDVGKGLEFLKSQTDSVEH